MCQKSDLYLFGAFHNHQFKLQGIHREKIKKGHNSVKNQNFKKYCFDLLSLRVLVQKIKYLGQVVMVLGQGQTHRQTHTQTDTHTDIPRTDQRLKTYGIFFLQFLFLFAHRRSNKRSR